MIKIDPVEFDNFTMSLVSDEANGFSGVVAISNKQSDVNFIYIKNCLKFLGGDLAENSCFL